MKAKKRLFFGLSPEQKVRDQLICLNQKIEPNEGKTIVAQNLHLTLHYIGISAEADCLSQKARLIRFRSFGFPLNTLGMFLRARVLWVGMDSAPVALQSLSDDCRKISTDCGSPGDLKCFRPHCSLRRKATTLPGPILINPIVWEVGSFHLFESISTAKGVQYNSLHEFTAIDA